MAPPERTGFSIIVACLVAALLIPIAVVQAVRAGKEDKRRPESSRWQAAEGDLLTESVEPGVELAPAPIADSPPEVEPALIAATADSLPAVEAGAIAPLPEPGPPPDKNAGAKVAVLPKQAPGAHKKAAPAKAKPAAARASGENRLFTLELSGTLGDEELDPGDAQTWARLSYFLRDEARRPHFLVYPDGSIPVSVPAMAGGKAPRPGAGAELPEPTEGDQPAYRLVVAASAAEGAGVTFYRQRLANSYRARVSCRIEKRGDGETWKLVRHLSADESIETKASGAEAGAIVRRVYDACFEKLLTQLASQPPFAAAIPTR